MGTRLRGDDRELVHLLHTDVVSSRPLELSDSGFASGQMQLNIGMLWRQVADFISHTNSMKTSVWVIFAFFLAFAPANAQITGTYKISKDSSGAFIEQIEFNADGTADILEVVRVMKFDGANKRFERATKEVRVECKTFIDNAFDEHIAWLKEDEILKDAESTKKIIRYRELGYNKLVGFVLKSNFDGKGYVVLLVGKGDEFVDLNQGFIFKKTGWFW